MRMRMRMRMQNENENENNENENSEESLLCIKSQHFTVIVTKTSVLGQKNYRAGQACYRVKS